MASRAGKSFDDYDDLHRYSITDPAQFWSSFRDFAKVIGDKDRPPFLVDADKTLGTRFLPGALRDRIKMNIPAGASPHHVPAHII